MYSLLKAISLSLVESSSVRNLNNLDKVSLAFLAKLLLTNIQINTTNAISSLDREPRLVLYIFSNLLYKLFVNIYSLLPLVSDFT